MYLFYKALHLDLQTSAKTDSKLFTSLRSSTNFSSLAISLKATCMGLDSASPRVQTFLDSMPDRIDEDF